jgi:hypothetical protein
MLQIFLLLPLVQQLPAMAQACRVPASTPTRATPPGPPITGSFFSTSPHTDPRTPVRIEAVHYTVPPASLTAYRRVSMISSWKAPTKLYSRRRARPARRVSTVSEFRLAPLHRPPRPRDASSGNKRVSTNQHHPQRVVIRWRTRLVPRFSPPRKPLKRKRSTVTTIGHDLTARSRPRCKQRGNNPAPPRPSVPYRAPHCRPRHASSTVNFHVLLDGT